MARPRMSSVAEYNATAPTRFNMTPDLPWPPVYEIEAVDEWDVDEADDTASAGPARTSLDALLSTLSPDHEVRRRQINAASQKRRRDKWKREVAAPPEKPQPTFRQFVAEVCRISMGGVMPTMERYNFCKPVTWPTAQEMCESFGVTWSEVAEYAGLKERKP